MSKRPSFAAFKKRVLQDKEVKAAYDLLESEFALLEKFIWEKQNQKNIAAIQKNSNAPVAQVDRAIDS